jgi:hypothetical protein
VLRCGCHLHAATGLSMARRSEVQDQVLKRAVGSVLLFLLAVLGARV